MWWFEEHGGRKGCLLLVWTGRGRVLVTDERVGSLQQLGGGGGGRQSGWG